jgi:hypothetical protein
MNHMYHEETEQLLAKGREALANYQEYLALVCFEKAIRMEWSPEACSSLAYCRAKVKGELPGVHSPCPQGAGTGAG